MIVYRCPVVPWLDHEDDLIVVDLQLVSTFGIRSRDVPPVRNANSFQTGFTIIAFTVVVLVQKDNPLRQQCFTIDFLIRQRKRAFMRARLPTELNTCEGCHAQKQEPAGAGWRGKHEGYLGGPDGGFRASIKGGQRIAEIREALMRKKHNLAIDYPGRNHSTIHALK